MAVDPSVGSLNRSPIDAVPADAANTQTPLPLPDRIRNRGDLRSTELGGVELPQDPRLPSQKQVVPPENYYHSTPQFELEPPQQLQAEATPKPLINPYTNQPILPVSKRVEGWDPNSDEFIRQRARLSSVEVSVRPKFDSLPGSTLTKEQIKRLKASPSGPVAADAGTGEHTPPIPRPLVTFGRRRTLRALPLVSCAAAALTGFIIWIIAVLVTNEQLLWAAPALGLAVGLTSLLTGGRGMANGLLCGLFALAAIAAARVTTASSLWYVLEAPTSGRFSDPQLRAAYDAEYAVASDFVNVETDAQLRGFLVAHRLTSEKDPAAVSAAEVAAFRDGPIPGQLRSYARENPTFEAWQRNEAGRMGPPEGFAPPLAHKLSLALSILDIPLILAGWGVAFLIGRKREEDF